MKTQKTKTSKAIRIFIAIAAVLLLVPFPIGYKDGGTVKYRAALYCVTKQHSIAFDPLEQEDGYDIGTAVEILGFEVYNDVEYYSIQTLIELNK
ncbi:MAG: hypothetical protein HFJ89_02495 [Oscillospiraceae bacterium]|jgi:hypothetical protein|nr:hypothetical protein [Oscillospiraceae bacterium]